jgi:glutathione S-transferase
MEPKITLYTLPQSQNGVRPEIALLEKGLAFEKVAVDLFKGEHKQPPFSDITPRGQIPVLVYDDGVDEIVVYESIAIIRFVDAMHPDPPLMPPSSEPRRFAEAVMRIEEFQAKLDVKNIFGSVLFGGQNREQLGERVDQLLEELPRWDVYVTGRNFLAGDQFTLADIAVFPLLMHFEAMGFDYAGHTPALSAYMDRCKARPSIKETRWVERFVEFASGRNPNQVLADLRE